MTNHPMLQMREPPPEIDVTKPAFQKVVTDTLNQLIDNATMASRWRERIRAALGGE